MRPKLLTIGLLLGLIVGGVAGFDLAGLRPVLEITRSMTLTETKTERETSYATSTVSLQPPKWVNKDQPVVAYTDAGKYMGATKTVEGVIVRTYSTATMIFLYFHDPSAGYFVVSISRSALSNFGFAPETYYLNREVRVTGRIQLYQNSPEIVAQGPWQIEVAFLGFNYP